MVEICDSNGRVLARPTNPCASKTLTSSRSTTGTWLPTSVFVDALAGGKPSAAFTLTPAQGSWKHWTTSRGSSANSWTRLGRPRRHRVIRSYYCAPRDSMRGIGLAGARSGSTVNLASSSSCGLATAPRFNTLHGMCQTQPVLARQAAQVPVPNVLAGTPRPDGRSDGAAQPGRFYFG